jgi:hypothetical protein
MMLIRERLGFEAVGGEYKWGPRIGGGGCGVNVASDDDDDAGGH